eukprot:6185655-Pleurochrysis_carterae.AAC.6
MSRQHDGQELGICLSGREENDWQVRTEDSAKNRPREGRRQPENKRNREGEWASGQDSIDRGCPEVDIKDRKDGNAARGGDGGGGNE